MKSPLLHLADTIFNTPLAILPEKLDTILRAIGPRLTLDPTSIDSLLASGVLKRGSGQPKDFDLSAYWDDDEDDSNSRSSGRRSDPGYKLTDSGVAVIPISGVLMKRGGWMSALSGCSSYQGIGRALSNAMTDTSVKGVLFDVNSPGGSTNGCFELADTIHGYRGQKPMFAVSNDLAASAAYALASSADRVFVTRTGAVGSIGVFSLHCSQASLDDKLGLDYTYIHYGDKKVDGNEHSALSKSAKADTQAEVDRQGDIFTSTVARNRNRAGASFESIRALQAGVLFADRSIPLLADAVGTYDDALTELVGKVNRNGVTLPMTGTKTGTAADPAPDPSPSTTVATTEGALQMDAAELKATLDAFKTGLLAEVSTVVKSQIAATIPTQTAPTAATAAPVPTSTPTTSPAPAPTAAKKADDMESKKDPEETEPDGDEECMPNSKKGALACRKIVEMCSLSGFKADAADFITKNMSVASVRRELLDRRSKESASTSVSPFLSTANLATAATALATISQRAESLSASNPRLTPVQAMEQAIRQNAAAYKAHNQIKKQALSNGLEEEYLVSLKPQLAAFGLSTGGY